MTGGRGSRGWRRPGRPRRARAFAAVAVVVLALLTTACPGGGPGPSPDTTTSGSGPSETPGGPLRIGSLQPGSGSVRGCPEGFECRPFVVRCPDLRQPAAGSVQILRPSTAPRGLAVFFSGDTGQRPFAPNARALEFIRGLSERGLVTAMVVWDEPWFSAAPGEEAGPALMACRPAAVVRWTHDELYAPLGLHPRSGGCGFCLAGTSAGSSQVAYALSRFGLAGIVDAVVLGGGMPHASIQRGCGDPTSAYFYGPDTEVIDASYGFVPGSSGPCTRGDDSFAGRWRGDSVDAPGAALRYPDTRVWIIEGGLDVSPAAPRGVDYGAALEAAGTAVVVRKIPGLGHGLASDPAGLEAVSEGLLGG